MEGATVRSPKCLKQNNLYETYKTLYYMEQDQVIYGTAFPYARLPILPGQTV